MVSQLDPKNAEVKVPYEPKGNQAQCL